MFTLTLSGSWIVLAPRPNVEDLLSFTAQLYAQNL